MRRALGILKPMRFASSRATTAPSRWTFALCGTGLMPPTSTDQFSLMVSANGSSGNEREGQQIVKGTTMALENVVLSANQSDEEACLVERAPVEAEIPTRAGAESTSVALFSNVRCKDSQAINTKGMNDSFEYLVGASSSV